MDAVVNPFMSRLPATQPDRYADLPVHNQAWRRFAVTVWAWIHARLQEPNTITGVLVVLLVMILLLQHPLARAIGTESPPAALAGSTDTSAAAGTAVAPISVASLGHAWTKLPDRAQRDPFQPLVVGQQGVVQTPASIGPAPAQASAPPAGSTSGLGQSGQGQSGQSGGQGQTGQGQSGQGTPNPGNPSSGHHHGHSGVGTSPKQSGGRCFASHVVQSGESLWSISTDDLMTHGYASVGAAWRALYAANRSLIGDNPSFLVPGERLCLPAS